MAAKARPARARPARLRAGARPVALVTGASSGFGAAIARALAADGHAVLCAGRNAARTRATVEAIRKAGGEAAGFLGDVRHARVCKAAVAATLKAFGRLDVLVNNAGIGQRKTVADTTDREWKTVMAVNVDSVFYLSRAAIPAMRRRKKGVVINIASDWGLVGAKDAAGYCASKGAVVQLSRAMALDHAREGIRVIAVCPGDCDTPIMHASAKAYGISIAKLLEGMAEELPIGRIGTAWDVAHLVAFLASDKASFITGAAIAIDGGNTAQ